MTHTGFAQMVAATDERDCEWYGVESFSWSPTVATYNYGPCGLVRAAAREVVDVPQPEPRQPKECSCVRAVTRPAVVIPLRYAQPRARRHSGASGVPAAIG